MIQNVFVYAMGTPAGVFGSVTERQSGTDCLLKLRLASSFNRHQAGRAAGAGRLSRVIHLGERPSL